MTVSQKRAIWYKMRKREVETRFYYLNYKGLMDEYEDSCYKNAIWFIRSKGLEREYNAFCHYNHAEIAEYLRNVL